jgi:hypothetical protein
LLAVTTTAAIRRYRHDRRRKGLCGQVGCKQVSGADYHCPIHAAAHAARMKLARQKARVAA